MEINKQDTEFLIQSSVIDVSKYDDSFVGNALQKRMAETYCDSIEKYVAFLGQNSMEKALLSESMHICYSEHFRNSLTFGVLERIILPSIVLKKKNNKQKDIRIWSAACAGGHEAYSLAILLEELSNPDATKCSYRIFATDQSELQISDAIKGQYTNASLNNVSLKRLSEWFSQQGDTYTVKPKLQNNIVFSVFDLFNEELSCPPESIYGDFDLAFCSNLLFYYKEEYRKLILDKVENSLANGGYLITGEAERDILFKRNFREVYPQSAIFQV